MFKTMLKKEYDFRELESKWLERWDDSIYYFDENSDKPPYIIDTPPPYPTGDFHIGNALNWCYIDFIARYKRMRGYNVKFPQGWDCHGLPTEVKVEENYGITKNEIPRQEFRKLCEELTKGNIEKMKETMRRLGMSIDWSSEYITMDPNYFKKTQISFVKMYRDGYIYREEHPVNWCPRCETAIAFAEVKYEERKTFLNTIRFGEIDIATTRPELIPACVAVAVHPEDERYADKIGRKTEVPLFGYKVEIFSDSSVDPNFGTGAVMICTFGDRQDVKWWKEHDLPLRKAIDKSGRMTDICGKYAGMTIDECKNAIIEDLGSEGLLLDQKEIEQSVGLCWRCDTPIEILSETQWFVRIEKERIIEAGRRIKWYPDHFYIRLKNWVESMEWDWCISRQRVFGTPIPVWYCKNCGSVAVAEKNELPVDPTLKKPNFVCKCGSKDFDGEKDVLDTWMDSSISSLWVGGWDRSEELSTYRTHLRPQGHDIIRTWAFYTILRSLALVGDIPWDTILINGMVLGEDGYKMSKSRGNIIAPEEAIEKYGSDAFRQWAAFGGSPGSDVMFRWKDVIAASRFLQKLWSILRFSVINLSDGESGKEVFIPDRWILIKLNELVRDVTESMEGFKFDEAMRSIRSFCWEVLADNYIELVKSRLYSGNEEERSSAQSALRKVIDVISRLLAPFMPFFAEEMHSVVGEGSVHLREWPEYDEKLCDEETKRKGDLISKIASAIRRYKSDRGIPLNAPLRKIVVYAEDLEIRDIAGATNSDVELVRGKPEFEMRVSRIKPKMNVLGPRYRKDAKKIIDALSRMHPLGEEKIVVNIDGKEIELDESCVEIERTPTLRGEDVDVLDVDGVVIAIMR
ncbi:MAG: valine--tRNA ligase [Candidatus Syntropharchaeia archaeon]